MCIYSLRLGLMSGWRGGGEVKKGWGELLEAALCHGGGGGGYKVPQAAWVVAGGGGVKG